MSDERKPQEERAAEDYIGAADDALGLARVLAGEGGIGDQAFPERMARSEASSRVASIAADLGMK